MSRSVVREVFIDAPPDVVWRAITEADELIRWFPMDARVEPGRGGSIFISWGDGAGGEAPITAWEPGRHFQWTETRGTTKIAVDFHLDTRDGGTIVRVVQSGFGDSSDWDDEYHMVEGGWMYFLANLQWYLERHRGVRRDLIGLRERVPLSRSEAYGRLCELVKSLDGVPFVEREHSGQAGFTVPSLSDAIAFVEIEPGVNRVRGGLWLSTYGLPPPDFETLRTRVTFAYRQALALTMEAGPSGPAAPGLHRSRKTLSQT